MSSIPDTFVRVALYELSETPELDRPVLVVGLQGWIDAGMGAAAAIDVLRGQLQPRTIATFDDDTLIDYRSRRPTIHLVDGLLEDMTWATTELLVGTDRSGTNVLLLLGAEPDRHWRPFTDAVVELAERFGVRLVVGLGAYPAPTPHTRPSRVVSTATTSDLAKEVGYVPGALDVPAGVQAAIEVRCRDEGLPAVGLWAPVPHYASGLPYPAASASLVDGLADIAGLDLDASTLHAAAETNRTKLDALIASSDQHRELVRLLEDQVDSIEESFDIELPSGDELAAELQRYLREQEG